METKKDALMGVRFGALSRIVACILSVVLAVGMMPSGAIAYAAEGDGSGASQESESAGAVSSDNRVNQDVQLDTSGSSSDEGSNTTSADEDGASAPAADESASVGNATGSAAESASTSAASAKYTNSVNGQTSADVSLNGHTTVGTIEYNGLAYTINADAPDTVAVTGIASSAPKGDLVIPAQVSSGDKLYKVTKIVRGGGRLRQIMPVI